eukprot:CAMPEP_0114622924 /NCGR_PEP_ID=MMETSP0168-20121206/9984_1 /TAXON_ID=95228 ORGANISM="Vannella sp., Strain DIVA3 517/6/12" /NCGR_SAMPLE_ID=MMETSP0168 /ASSEMBLY_ACC=CAM_ASM_000044 /LENGTH=643 /DNA_ID=CAMNT_0001834147 /DNA_START=93 /DNA_END=2024 /DNA_ORIENTATION=-
MSGDKEEAELLLSYNYMQAASKLLPQCDLWSLLSPNGRSLAEMWRNVHSLRVLELKVLAKFVRERTELWRVKNMPAIKADLVNAICSAIYTTAARRRAAGTPQPRPLQTPQTATVRNAGALGHTAEALKAAQDAALAARTAAVARRAMAEQALQRAGASNSNTCRERLAAVRSQLQQNARLLDNMSRSSPPPAQSPAQGRLPSAKADLPHSYTGAVRSAPAHTAAPVLKKRKMNLGARCTEQGLANARYPFHSLLSVVHVAEWGRSARSPYPCVFTMSKEELQWLRRSEVSLVARLHDWRKKTDISWASSGASLTVGVKREAMPPSKKRRNKASAFFAPPVVIRSVSYASSGSVSLSLSAYSAAMASTALVIELVEVRTCAQLAATVQELEDTKLRSSTDDGVVETGFQVSLRCPLGFIRIESPGKGINCTHVQCFDLETYVQFGKNQMEWFCPVCTKRLPVKDLRRSKYFSSILEFAKEADEDDVVEIDPSSGKMTVCKPAGTMVEYGGAGGPKKEPSMDGSSQGSTQPSQTHSQGSVSSIVLLSDSDDDGGEEEAHPPPPPAGLPGSPSTPERGVDNRRPSTSPAPASSAYTHPVLEEDFDYFLDWAVASTGAENEKDPLEHTLAQPSSGGAEVDVIVISD